MPNEGIKRGTHSATLYEYSLMLGVILSFIQKSSTLGVHWICGLVGGAANPTLSPNSSLISCILGYFEPKKCGKGKIFRAREYLGGQGEPIFMARSTKGAVCDMGAWEAWDASTILVRTHFQKKGDPKAYLLVALESSLLLEYIAGSETVKRPPANPHHCCMYHHLNSGVLSKFNATAIFISHFHPIEKSDDSPIFVSPSFHHNCFNSFKQPKLSIQRKKVTPRNH